MIGQYPSGGGRVLLRKQEHSPAVRTGLLLSQERSALSANQNSPCYLYFSPAGQSPMRLPVLFIFITMPTPLAMPDESTSMLMA